MLGWIATALVVLSTLLPNTLTKQAYSKVSDSSAQAATPTLARSAVTPASYAAVPATASNNPEPKLTATSAMVYDIDSAKVLYAKNARAQTPIASITKVMTALVILQNHSLDETVTIPELPAQPFASQAMGIKAGEQFKLSEALSGMLIYSANDMAQALARWDSGSETAFVAKMNAMAAQWQLSDTHYVDATGLQANDAHSSAQDLATLASVALRNSFFRQAVSQPRYTVTTLSGRRYNVTTTNQLLGMAGVVGIKTGYTPEAGECHLSLTRRQGHEIIGVVLNSSARFAESRSLIDWSFAHYNWQ